MYNALSSLGAGGLATPWYANATTAAGFGEIHTVYLQARSLTRSSFHGFPKRYRWCTCQQDWCQDISPRK